MEADIRVGDIAMVACTYITQYTIWPVGVFASPQGGGVAGHGAWARHVVLSGDELNIGGDHNLLHKQLQLVPLIPELPG